MFHKIAQNIGQKLTFSVEFSDLFLGKKGSKNREKIAVLFAEQTFGYHSIYRAKSHVNLKPSILSLYAMNNTKGRKCHEKTRKIKTLSTGKIPKFSWTTLLLNFFDQNGKTALVKCSYTVLIFLNFSLKKRLKIANFDHQKYSKN